MTNKEDEGEPVGNPRLAAILAVHVVGQVLDEACAVVNSALESGKPWSYRSDLKKIKSDNPVETEDEDELFGAPQGDSDVNENKIEHGANIVATSTPQKVTGTHLLPKPESSFIGQGDEEFDQHDESTNSTSMFINNLFDMSDVEKLMSCNEKQNIPDNSDINELKPEATKKVIDNNKNVSNIQAPKEMMANEKKNTPEDSEYSFLSDAFERDIAFYIHDDDLAECKNICDNPHLVPKVKIAELFDNNPDDEVQKKHHSSVARLENAYLTLNRDYEQYSDDEADPILEDPRGMTLQEVELLTANTSEENIMTRNKDSQLHVANSAKEKGQLETLAGSTSDRGPKKSSLVARCRRQGAKYLASVRGWWRQRIPGRRKEIQVPNMARGLCPLSPDARRRAASLLDQRHLRSPAIRSGIWKFNTVNETVVHSSHWKDYTFDVNPECGEC